MTWAQLDVHSNATLNDSLQAYSSGLIEGHLTADLIDFHWNNNIQHYCDNSSQFCDILFPFIEKNVEFMKTEIKKYAKTDEYWHQIELSLIQLTGIEDGYRAARDGVQPLGARIDLSANG
ncbi:unnamed protein product, partial [Medioppia subpectinata]